MVCVFFCSTPPCFLRGQAQVPFVCICVQLPDLQGRRKCDRAGEAAGIVDCSGENDLGIDFDAKPVANGVKGPQTKDEGIKHCVHLFWNE